MEGPEKGLSKQRDSKHRGPTQEQVGCGHGTGQASVTGARGGSQGTKPRREQVRMMQAAWGSRGSSDFYSRCGETSQEGFEQGRDAVWFI